MTYTFYGEPNMLVKRKKRRGFGNVKCTPLFRFDEDGKHVCPEVRYPEAILNRLKQKYRYEVESDDVKTEPEPAVVPEKIYHCKKCDFTCTDKVTLMCHYRDKHPKDKKVQA